MFLSRAKSWLPGLPWWWRRQRGKEKELNAESEEWREDGKETGEGLGPARVRWWSGRCLLDAIGWGHCSATGDRSLLAGIPQHLGPPKPAMDAPEHFQICFNFMRYLFDLCVVTLLCASSPAFRLVLDILGFGGPLKVWLHGFACFLVTAYGMYLALWLVQEYLVQFACLYGFLQTLVLCVSIRVGSCEPQEGHGIAGTDLAAPEEEPPPAKEDGD